MATKKKLLEAAAGAAGGAALNVENVFSTYLYDGAAVGSGDIQIQNSVDLNGEGGLVWTKGRSLATPHFLTDTERGGTKSVFSNLTNAEATNANLMSFNSDGFTLGSGAVGWSSIAGNGEEYCSWTFRKAPKFFDVVTYTGTGSARTISHSLNTTPGLIICKPTSGTGQWAVWHRSNGNNKVLYLNLNYANSTTNTVWNNTAPTSTVFSVGASAATNESGVSYVAYLFAHNNGDGEFGPTGDQDVIRCGSYTGNGSTTGPVIDLGWEPQWLLLKNAGDTGGWYLFDAMRGLTTSSINDAFLQPDSSVQEDASKSLINILPNGFQLNTIETELNTSSTTYIYIAIRRGPMAVPESATDVFATQLYYNGSNPQYTSNFPVDMGILKDVTGADGLVSSRLTQGKFIYLNTDAETTNSTVGVFDYQDGFSEFLNSTSVAWMWRRAPSFFDVVTYTGTSVARTLSHNLGVAPEMMIIKNRGNVKDWTVYHTGLGETKKAVLNKTSTPITSATAWNNTAPTEAVFSVGTLDDTNESPFGFIAYLFASLSGISKCGSYTGNGSTQTIDCGFSSGARFVLIKRTDSTGDWYVWDTERGIVAANDPHLSLNTTAAEVTTDDSVDPVSSGFAVNQVAATNINVSSATYIFYAIA